MRFFFSARFAEVLQGKSEEIQDEQGVFRLHLIWDRISVLSMNSEWLTPFWRDMRRTMPCGQHVDAIRNWIYTHSFHRRWDDRVGSFGFRMFRVHFLSDGKVTHIKRLLKTVGKYLEFLEGTRLRRNLMKGREEA